MIVYNRAELVLVFISKIIDLGTAVSFSVSSWGRTPKHNQAVGGVVNSKHLDFLAIDVVCDNKEDHEQLAVLAKNAGLVVIDEKTHLHLQDGENI